MRHIGEQHSPRVIDRLKLRIARRQRRRHLIERLRQCGHFVAAVFASARREIAFTDFTRGMLEAAEPAAHRSEDQESRRGRANADQQQADDEQRGSELLEG